MTPLDLTSDPVSLTAALVDIPSPSHHEKQLADLVEAALRRLPGLPDNQIIRRGNTVAAATRRGLGRRVILAGHLDTVPLAGNVPHQLIGDILHGCGTVDMKSGMAVYLHLFALLADAPDLTSDLTLIAYEAEEVESRFNGLGHLAVSDPEWLRGDLALLGEPSNGIIEAGCQGTLRLRVTAHGARAHSARAWLGENAAHKIGPVIARIADYEARRVKIDGCHYREGLNVVQLESFVATNTIPDKAHVLVNFRFAPDRTEDDALDHVLRYLAIDNLDDGFTVTLEDSMPGALPGLQQPAAAALIESVGEVRAKLGWTDVARFAPLGVPAVNFGPGDPAFAHRVEEQVPVGQITQVASQLRNFLTTRPS
ncbi:succinyl-diaminopimelate desuccinylase [Corynebacterium hylobatis]|uniref:Succinyl-diaminopimelate desuccinylase n=1 Tax=Corynebacterium hylobatis TaxID=1859290 RepID=A0A3S0B5U5_9CORY|nr:succinyl-diaminopimelate desuccinylase [Corynebacterium hylobatis]RSZ65482.1 succinyl-diaminopimelate desuccinylase [Corynebacterium hylobatis]